MKLKLVEQFSGSLNFMMETFKGENYFLPNCGKTESLPAVNKPT